MQFLSLNKVIRGISWERHVSYSGTEMWILQRKYESQCVVSTKELRGMGCTMRMKEFKVGLIHHVTLPPCTAATHLQNVVELHFELKVGLGLDDDLLQRLLQVLHAVLGVLTQLGDALVLPLAA